MLSSDLGRYAGLAAIFGGILFALSGFVEGTSWAHVVVDAVRHGVLLAGVVGLYLNLRKFDRFRLWGTVGFFVSALWLAMITILDLGILLNSELESVYEGLGPLRMVGLLGAALFGVGALRAAPRFRGGGWLLIAAVIAYPLGVAAMVVSDGALGGWIWLVPTLLFGLGWAWLGYGLWSGSRT